MVEQTGGLGDGFCAADVPLDISPVTPWLDGPLLPMASDISMGVCKNDLTLRRRLDEWLTKNKQMVGDLLSTYAVATTAQTPWKRWLRLRLALLSAWRGTSSEWLSSPLTGSAEG